MTDTEEPIHKQPFWAPIVAAYQGSQRWKSIWQLVNSFVPFFLAWYLMYRSLEVSLLLTFLLALPAAGFLIRIFIIQHDCGHGSFFHSRKANDLWGTVASVLSLTPYHYWRKSHAIHHASAGKLDERGIGDIPTLTVEEFRRKSWRGRLAYRLYRNPLVLFLFFPTFLFMVVYRFPTPASRSLQGAGRSIHLTSLAIGLLAGAVIWLVGWKSFLLVQLPITFLSSTAGLWLFYVQHQFEDTYWNEAHAWEYSMDALRGSSYYRLPRILQWFTGNIGFHHIHHLAPKIPNYRLERCHRENPALQRVAVLTLRSSLKSLRLRLWDEEAKKLVSFAHLRERSVKQV